MKLTLTILLVAVTALADTVVSVNRRPQENVSTDTNAAISVATTSVTYDVSVPGKFVTYNDSIVFPDLSACLAEPSIVTNAIFNLCSFWNTKFNADWNLTNPTINFAESPLVSVTNFTDLSSVTNQ